MNNREKKLTIKLMNGSHIRIGIYIGAITLIGFIGAVISKAASEGKISPNAYIPISIAAGLIWIRIAEMESERLIYASILYDAAYAISYVIGFALLGESPRPINILGIIIALIGVALTGS